MIWRRAFLAGLTAMASAFAAPGIAGDGSRVASPPANAAAGESQLAAPVSYYRAETVSASFAKGAVLFDQGRDYMIHTSRRVEPGKAEVHHDDTDLIYVLEGSAVFVTGGAVVEGTETAPGEIRGSRIEGGETRRLSPGDVIIVPNGTPHWFKEVMGPVLYYTIKVR